MAHTEHPDDPNATGDAERLLEAALGDRTHLARERERLPELLAPNERLLAVMSAGLRSGRAGILAVTDRRLIHIYWGYFRHRLRVTEIDFMNVDSVRVTKWRSFATVKVRFKRIQRTAFLPSRAIDFPLEFGRDAGAHAEELATCIRYAARRVQEPVKTGSPQWKTVG